MVQERTGVPVYDLDELRPAQPPVVAPALDQTVKKARPRQMRRAYRAIDRAGRIPVAILPWVSVVMGLIWWPFLFIGLVRGVISYRYGQRGAGPALIVVGLVALLHVVNAATGHPLF